MGWLWLVLAYTFGLWVGFLVRAWIANRQRYVGTIFITHDEEKTLYSLELNEYPESIGFKKQVVFKVDASDVEVNRD